MSSYHKPVLLKQSIDGLNVKNNGIYVDLTYGGGGHSKEILKRLQSGKLIAFDQDEDVVQNIIDDKNLIFCKSNFRFFVNFLKYYNFTEVDGILADLGVSSYHFDSAKRGFSFRFDSELDMRMNKKSSSTAKKIINEYDENKLCKIFRTYGEINNANKIVAAIMKYRNEKNIITTKQLSEILINVLPKGKENKILAKIFRVF